MSNVTYSQVQELVKSVPPAKLERAYNIILNLTDKSTESAGKEISPVDFMKLSIPERRKIMKDQAQKLAVHYKEASTEREDWQGGDFFDESQTQ
jgi:hypothetical protein